MSKMSISPQYYKYTNLDENKQKTHQNRTTGLKATSIYRNHFNRNNFCLFDDSCDAMWDKCQMQGCARGGRRGPCPPPPAETYHPTCHPPKLSRALVWLVSLFRGSRPPPPPKILGTPPKMYTLKQMHNIDPFVHNF